MVWSLVCLVINIMTSYPYFEDKSSADECYWNKDNEPFAGEIGEYFASFPHAEHKDAVEMALRLTPNMASKMADLLGPQGLFTWPMPGWGRPIFDGDIGYDEDYPVITSVAQLISGFYPRNINDVSDGVRDTPMQNFLKGHVSHVLSQIRNVGMCIVVSDRNVVEPWLHIQSLRYVLNLVRDLSTTQIGFPIDSFYFSLEWYTNLLKMVKERGHGTRWVEELIMLGIIKRDTGGNLLFSSPVGLIISDSHIRGYLSSIDSETRSRTVWAQPLNYHLIRKT